MAQLGARFHGMEEVVSSNLTRSTKILHHIQLAVVHSALFACQSHGKSMRVIRLEYCAMLAHQTEVLRFFFVLKGA